MNQLLELRRIKAVFLPWERSNKQLQYGNNANSMPDGGASWDTKGTPGWSRSLINKEFDTPEGDTTQYFPIKKRGNK